MAMSRTDPLIQMTCPACGFDDQAYESWLRGHKLVCDECGEHMERDDGEEEE
jgi:transposase